MAKSDRAARRKHKRDAERHAAKSKKRKLHRAKAGAFRARVQSSPSAADHRRAYINLPLVHLPELGLIDRLIRGGDPVLNESADLAMKELVGNHAEELCRYGLLVVAASPAGDLLDVTYASLSEEAIAEFRAKFETRDADRVLAPFEHVDDGEPFDDGAEAQALDAQLPGPCPPLDLGALSTLILMAHEPELNEQIRQPVMEIRPDGQVVSTGVLGVNVRWPL